MLAMKGFALSCLLATVALATCAAERQPSVPSKDSASLEAELESGQLDQPLVLSAILRELGLHLMGDVRLLNAPERLELSESLRAAGVDLGSRSKLRRLSGGGTQSEQQLQLDESALLTIDSVKDKTPQRKVEENHRQLQEKTGFSLEVAAIVVTGLLGMVGYVVQARSAQKSSDAQASLEREAAVREKAEAKAGKQLERVQMQMADFVRPLVTDIDTFAHALLYVARELDLRAYLELYRTEFVAQPETPYVEMLHGNVETFAAHGKNPLVKIPPEDIDMLAADPAKRQRWAELCEHVLIPPLRRMSVVLATKSHLSEPTATNVLNKMMPGIGRDWSFIGTTSALFNILQIYLGQFESLLVCWARGEWERLQPSAPGVHFGLQVLVSMNMLKAVSTKEGELIGVSTGSAMDTTKIVAAAGGVIGRATET